MKPLFPQAPLAPTVALVFASFLLLAVPGALFGVVWPSVRGTFRLSQESAGTLLAIQFGCYFITSFFSGRIEGLLGAKGSVIAATGAMAAGCATMAGAQTWFVLLASSSVIGIGQGAVDGVVNIIVARGFAHRWMQWLHANFGVGSAATPILAQAAMIGFGSWRASYAIAAVFAALVCGATAESRFALGLPEGVAHNEAHSPLSATLSFSALWFGIVVFVVVAGVELTAGQWIYSLLTESLGLEPAPASALVSLYWACFTIGRIVAGWFLSDGYARQSFAVIRCCSAGVAIGALGLCRTGTTFAGILLFGFCLGLLFPLLVGDASFRFGPTHAPNAIGALVASSSIGLVSMPSLGALLAKQSLELMPLYMFTQAVVLIGSWECARFGRSPALSSSPLE